VTNDNNGPRVGVYIDGFNLYKGILLDYPQLKWLDLKALAKLLSPENDIGDLYYFTAEIAPLKSGDLAPARQKLYLRTLEVSGVNVVKGKFRADSRWMPIGDVTLNQFTRPELFGWISKRFATRAIKIAENVPRVLVTKFEEKRSDVNLASFLLRDVFQNGLTHAIVISGDTDLTTAIRFAVDAGCHVSVIIPRRSNASAALQNVASYVGWLKPSTLEQAQFPRSVLSPRGKPLLRPKEWT
jgi:uncharacterized LabA/DUF88 family protein